MKNVTCHTRQHHASILEAKARAAAEYFAAKKARLEDEAARMAEMQRERDLLAQTKKDKE